MDPQVVIGNMVWEYLTVKELGIIVQLSSYIRDRVSSSTGVRNRLIRFLERGIQGLRFNASMSSFSYKNFVTTCVYTRQIERLKDRRVVVLYPSCWSAVG